MGKVQDRESMGTIEILQAMNSQSILGFANTLLHTKSFSSDPQKNRAIKNLINMLIERIKMLIPFEKWSHRKSRSFIQNFVKEENKVEFDAYAPGKDPQCIAIMQSLFKELNIPEWAVCYDEKQLKFVPSKEFLDAYSKIAPLLSERERKEITINDNKNFVLDGREYAYMNGEQYRAFEAFKKEYVEKFGEEYVISFDPLEHAKTYIEELDFHSQNGEDHFINMNSEVYKAYRLAASKSHDKSPSVDENVFDVDDKKEAKDETNERDKNENASVNSELDEPIPKPANGSKNGYRTYNDMVYQQNIAKIVERAPEKLPYMTAQIKVSSSLILPPKEENKPYLIQIPSRKSVLDESGNVSIKYNTDMNGVLFAIDKELVSLLSKDPNKKSNAYVKLPLSEEVLLYDKSTLSPILDENGNHARLHLHEIVPNFSVVDLEMPSEVVSLDGKNLRLIEKDGFTFGVDENKTMAVVFGYEGKDPDLRIPASLELEDGTSVDVKEIAPYAFQNSKIESIAIPETVEVIRERSFERCYNLKDVSFESSTLKSVGNFAFEDCRSLKNVLLPHSVEQIGQNPFFLCNNLESFSVSESDSDIPSLLHVNDDGMLLMENQIVSVPYASLESHLMVDADVESVGAYAFAGSNISGVTFMGNVSHIDECAFGFCYYLKEFSTPLSDNVCLDDNAFSNSFIDRSGIDLKKVYAASQNPFSNTNIERELDASENMYKMDISAEPQGALIKIDTLEDARLVKEKFTESLSSLLVSYNEEIRELLNDPEFLSTAKEKCESMGVSSNNNEDALRLIALMSIAESSGIEIVGTDLDGDLAHIATHQTVIISSSCSDYLVEGALTAPVSSQSPTYSVSQSHTDLNKAKDVPEEIAQPKQEQEQEPVSNKEKRKRLSDQEISIGR